MSGRASRPAFPDTKFRAEITGLDRGAKVVMCTAMGQESLVEEAKQASASGYIIKPFNPQQVKGVIRKVAGL